MDVFTMVVVLAMFGVAGKMWQALLDHRVKVAGMRAGQPATGSLGSGKELEDLRREVEALRETTTGFDMAFDTALQRLESRVAHMEARMARYEADGQPTSQVTTIRAAD